MASAESEVLTTPESAIEYAITDPNIINVSQMFAQESIQALQQSKPLLYRTLEVFSYGAINDLPKEVDLPPAALKKLRQLSLVNLMDSSASNRQLPYAEVMQCLGIDSVRELEDIVIDGIYNKLFKARLDSKGQFIEVDDWASRDAPVHNIDAIVADLIAFENCIADVRRNVLEDADKRDAQAVADRKRMQQAEADLMAARKALDESLLAATNTHEPSTITKRKVSRPGKQRASQGNPSNK